MIVTILIVGSSTANREEAYDTACKAAKEASMATLLLEEEQRASCEPKVIKKDKSMKTKSGKRIIQKFTSR